MILKDWLGGMDSNQDSQSQSLESYQLDDLPAGRKQKGIAARPAVPAATIHFCSSPLGGRPIGRTPDSDSGYPGSSPGLPANHSHSMGYPPSYLLMVFASFPQKTEQQSVRETCRRNSASALNRHSATLFCVISARYKTERPIPFPQSLAKISALESNSHAGDRLSQWSGVSIRGAPVARFLSKIWCKPEWDDSVATHRPSGDTIESGTRMFSDKEIGVVERLRGSNWKNVDRLLATSSK